MNNVGALKDIMMMELQMIAKNVLLWTVSLVIIKGNVWNVGILSYYYLIVKSRKMGTMYKKKMMVQEEISMKLNNVVKDVKNVLYFLIIVMCVRWKIIEWMYPLAYVKKDIMIIMENQIHVKNVILDAKNGKKK